MKFNHLFLTWLARELVTFHPQNQIENQGKKGAVKSRSDSGMIHNPDFWQNHSNNNPKLCAETPTLTAPIKTVQCAVGRIWDRNQWVIFDRSGDLSCALYIEPEESEL